MRTQVQVLAGPPNKPAGPGLAAELPSLTAPARLPGSCHPRATGGLRRLVAVDLETDDVEAEVKRLEALGATRWDHQQERGFDFWVLRDPWGNEFCVLQMEFPELLARRRPWPD